MYTGEDDNHQMVIVTAFIEGRYVAHFGILIENPAHGIACVMNIGHIVLTAADGIASLHGVTSLGSVGFHISTLAVSCNETAEVIVCLAIGILAEVNSALDDSQIILAGECSLVSYLYYDYTLAIEDYFVVLTHGCSGNGLDELTVVLVHSHAFILGTGQPGLGARLIVFLGNRVEVGTCIECLHDAVGSQFSTGKVGARSCNLTNLYRVGTSHLADEADDVHRVVLHVGVGALLSAYSHRVHFRCNI